MDTNFLKINKFKKITVLCPKCRVLQIEYPQFSYMICNMCYSINYKISMKHKKNYYNLIDDKYKND